MDTADLQVKVSDVAGPRLDQLRSLALGMLVVGAVLFVIGWFLNPPRADNPGVFTSYLFAYLFWIGVSSGSLGLLMLHHTVGGGWGFLIRRFMEAGTRLFLPMAILFIPIVIALISFPLYRWAHAGPEDHIVHAKAAYLNVPFFLARTVLYFLIWMGLARFFNKWGATQDERSDPEIFGRLSRAGAGGLVLFVITITFMSVDWIMSLTPDWYSSIFGLLLVVAQGLSTLALMLALIGYLLGDKPLLGRVPSGYFRDLGNLMLAFTLLWAYMSFGQYLIIYSGNLAEEVGWYIDRREGGWGVISLLLIPFHFALPFLMLLLGSNIKRSPVRLARVALFLVVMRFVDLFWWVTPTFRDHVLGNAGALVGDIGAPLLIGGIWLWLWVGQVRDQYLVPLHDPRLEGELNRQGHGAMEHV